MFKCWFYRNIISPTLILLMCDASELGLLINEGISRMWTALTFTADASHLRILIHIKIAIPIDVYQLIELISINYYTIISSFAVKWRKIFYLINCPGLLVLFFFREKLRMKNGVVCLSKIFWYSIAPFLAKPKMLVILVE